MVNFLILTAVIINLMIKLSYVKKILYCFLILSFFSTNAYSIEKKRILDEKIFLEKLKNLSFINLENPKSHFLTIPNSNAKIEIIESEFYLLNDDVNQYNWWAFGRSAYDDTVRIFGEGYHILLSYKNIGYTKINDWNDVNAEALIQSLRDANQNQNDNRSYAKSINWIFKPNLNKDKKIVSYSYKVEWSNNKITMETKNLILGKSGHIEQTFVFDDPSNAKENSEYALKTASYVKFNKEYSYSNFKTGDKVAAVGIGALVAGSLGVKALKGAGSVAAKGGVILLFLKKFWWVFVAPFVFLGSFFKGNKNRSEKQPRTEKKKKALRNRRKE